MKQIVAFLSVLLFSTVAYAQAQKEINRGGCIDRFILTNTVNPAFEGYRVFVLCGTEHKIVYQVSGLDKTTFTDYCDTLAPDDPTCPDPGNIGPVYEEWDNAAQVTGDPLTPATKRLLIWAWVYQEHVKPSMNRARQEIINNSGYTVPNQRRAAAGAYMAGPWELSFLDAEFCGDILIDGPGRCDYEETGVTNVTGRLKALVEDLEDLVITLP